MIWLAILEYAILASTFTIAKVAVGYADPLFIIGVRMLVASPFMFLLHRLHQPNFIIKKSDLGLFIGTGICHIFLPFTGEFWALQYVSSAKTAIIYSLTPFVASLLSFLLLKKILTKMQTLGLLIGLLGLMPIFFSPDDISHVAGEFMHVSLPELVLLMCVTSASYAWFLVARLMSRGYSVSLINGVAMLIGGSLSMIAWVLFGDLENFIKGDVASFCFWTGLLVIVSNLISYNIYGYLLRHISINFMSAIGFLCPIFASIYGVVLLKESLGFSHLVAMAMVILGLWLFYRGEVRLRDVSRKKIS